MVANAMVMRREIETVVPRSSRFLSDGGRNLSREELIPKRESWEMKFKADTPAEARPTSPSVNILAATVQNMKPRRVVKTLLLIRKVALRCRLLL
jgi:hypothetical protein